MKSDEDEKRHWSENAAVSNAGSGCSDWIKEPGVAISCCYDGLRPVIFRRERTDEAIER